MNLRHTVVAALFALGISAAVPAQAATITYDLNNITFVGGGAATGTFDFNTVTDTFTSWSIVTTPTTNLGALGGYGLNGTTYTTTGTLPTLSYSSVQFLSGSNKLALIFGNGFPSATGPVAITGGFESANNGFETRSIVSGGSVSAVPLPAAWLMFGAALAAFGLWGFARKARPQQAIQAA